MIGLKGVPFPAGIENFTEQVGYRLVERGHEVVVYCRPYVDVGERYRGMRMRRLPSVNTKHLDALTHTALSTIGAAFDDLDIAHYHALGPSVFSLITRLRGIHTVTHVHGLDYQRAKWSTVARRCLKAAEYGAGVLSAPDDRCVSHGAALPRATIRTPRSRTYRPVWTALNTGSRVRSRAGVSTTRAMCSFSPDWFRRRDVTTSSARSKVCVRARSWSSAGPAAHPESYARELRRTDHPNIVFTGAVTGRLLEELFSNAYVFVLPSEIEGLSHALLQALGAGRCVLASDIAPNIEALGGCGLTFRNRDVDDLQRQLQSLLDDPGLVRARSAGSRERVASHLRLGCGGGLARSALCGVSGVSGVSFPSRSRHGDTGCDC